MGQVKNNLKQYSYITLCNGENGQQEKIENELSSIIQQKPNQVKELSINSLLPEEKQNKIKHTFNFRISKNDLKHFDKDIDSFIGQV